MGWEATSEGITINKLFGKKVISYSDLKSVRYNTETITFITKDEEETTLKNGLNIEIEPLYEALPKYNISYIDEDENKEGRQLYDIDEINEKAAAAKEAAFALINPKVKERFGEEYDIGIDIEPVDNFIDMYFSLNKNGEEVDFFGAFDDIVVAYLVKWDAGYGGRYGVTVEMEDETAFAKAVQAVFAYLLEHYE